MPVSAFRSEQPAAADGSRLGPLLPPELPWLYAVIPLPAAYLMGHNLIGKPWPQFVRGLVTVYFPFVVFGLVFYLVYQFAMPRLLRPAFGPCTRMAVHAGAVGIVTPLVALAIYPLMDRIKSGGRMGEGDFVTVSYIFASACIFPAVAVQHLRQRARAAEHRVLIERQAALEAQLAALRARTDPHFLFNSLNTVASLISENPVLAERTLERLADLFRYALDSSRLRTVKLERELSMVADYLELQSARFGDRLHTSLHVDGGLGDFDIPPLLLQPLVENAIVHGMALRREGRVEIWVRRERSQLVVEVGDDGPGPGRSGHAGAGTAVAVVRERLNLHYAGRGSLSLREQSRGGCLARLELPIGASP